MLSTILKHLLYFITVSNMQIFGFKKKKQSESISCLCSQINRALEFC